MLTLVSINSVGELIKCGRDLQSLQKDSLLSLESDILGPSDKSGQISLWLDITSNSEILWGLFKERVPLDLGSLGSLSSLFEFSFSLKRTLVKCRSLTHHDLLSLNLYIRYILFNQAESGI